MDSGYAGGSEVPVYYDPLLAKLICWGKDKTEALNKMVRALDEMEIAGIITNKKFLKDICTHKDFISGNYNINFLAHQFISELSEEKNIDAAAVFAVLMKKHLSKKPNMPRSDNSNWLNLQYE